MLMQSQGRLYAFDVSEGRLNKFKPRLKRSGLSNVHPQLLANENDIKVKRLAGKIDRVLVDAPCTGLGALRRRPEARWRRHPEDVAELTRLQRELLTAALRHVRPGGVVAYITCSPHLAETVGVVAAVSRRRGKQAADGEGIGVEQLDARAYLPDVPDLGPGPAVQLWPHRHGTDAMFLALLRRSG